MPSRSHFPKLRENTSSTVQRLLNENIRNVRHVAHAAAAALSLTLAFLLTLQQSKSVHSLVPEYVGNLVKMKEVSSPLAALQARELRL